MVFVLERLPSLLAALALLGLALWLLWFDFETRLHRAFALVMVLKAFFLGLLAFAPNADSLAAQVRIYFAIGIPFAALYFALVFRSHYSRPERPRRPPSWVWVAGLSIGAALLLALYALERDLYRDAFGEAGPLVLAVSLPYMAFAFIALVFVRAGLRQDTGNRRTALLLAGLAFSLQPLHHSLYVLAGTPISVALGPFEWREYFTLIWAAERAAWLTTFVLVGLVAALLVRACWRHDGLFRGDAIRSLAAMTVPVATAGLSLVALLSDILLGTRFLPDLHLAFSALWVLAAAAIIVYAILNHHFLDRQPRVRGAVRTSTAVGALLLVFFVAKELLEEVLQGYYPVLPGLGAAVVAVFLLQPILFIVARVLHGMIPEEAALSDLKPNERRAVYRHQVEVVWMDGLVTRKERLLLDRMRERLGLSAEVAQRIEEEILGPRTGGAGTHGSASAGT